MINFALGGISLANNVASYQVTKSDISGGNSFTDVNGDRVADVLGVKTTLKISLNKLDAATAGSVMTALYGDSITITATAPADFSGTYKRDGDVTLSNGWVDKVNSQGTTEWKIDFTISKTDSGSSGSDGL